jgi:hypothetical protein
MEMRKNVFSAGIASMVQQIGVSIECPAERQTQPLQVARLLTSAAVVVLSVSMQVFLVLRVQQLVCSGAVHAIREVYSDYEEHMYSRTYMTVNGLHRGSGPEFFLPSNFDSLDDEVKTTICQVPLSQPDFLFAVLFMWSLTVFAEIRACFASAHRFLWITDTSSHTHVQVSTPMGCYDEKEHGVRRRSQEGTDYGLDDGQSGLLALSRTVKVVIGTLFAAEIVTSLFLLWIGCRWLLATPCFSDLILNGLALVFIVQIKDMLYEQVLPHLFQHETEVVRVKRASLSLDCHTIATPIVWTTVSATWVGLYMFYFQAVLPDYRWDVRGPCFEFLSEQLRS